MKWMPKDIIAILVICIAGYLLSQGIDTQVGWALIAIVAGYYGIDLTPLIKIGRVQGKKKEEEAKDNGGPTDTKTI